MPIEGLPSTDNGNAQGTGTATQQQPANTSDATDQNTGATASNSGAVTDTAQQTQAQTQERTFTQADVDRIVQNRLKSAVKAELKKLTGDGDVASVEDLQRQLSEERNARQRLEARHTVREYLTDPRHKLNLDAGVVPEIEELVAARLEYDDDGKPSNLKETVESLKSRLPRLFANTQSNINANNGRGAQPGPLNMNDFVRQQLAGR